MPGLIDFTAVHAQPATLYDFAQAYTVTDLIEATNASLDLIRDLIERADNTAVVFDPLDPDAHDANAKPGEETIGWSLAHLICHVTSTSEEYAAYGSILARGIAYVREPRLRYETDWRLIDTQTKALQRLDESRRIRLGYLATFPDVPDTTTQRDISTRYHEMFGPQNALSAVMLGLYHEWQHFDQFREVLRQALAAQVEAATTPVSTSAPSATATSASGLDVDPRADMLGG